MQASKVLMLIGSALVTSKLGRSVSAIELDDVLGVMGLARRRSYLGQSLALLGVGIAVGAGTALLLAPASGSETRKRLSQGVEKLTEQAVAKLEQVERNASTPSSRSNHDPRAVA
jgi:YtxH-like protein